MEIDEGLDEPQIFGLISGGRFQRLQFGLNRLILFAEFWHAATKLIQAHQTFLVGNQQAVHAFPQSCMIPAQLIFSLLQRVGIFGRYEPAVQLILNDVRSVQQPHDFLPDHGVKLVLPNRWIVADGAL